ncbi:uncharacterized protein J3R85_003242 [Psidium guajava]|nr:uncharacterized protein J3R85_003242 [Psidium guajava]
MPRYEMKVHHCESSQNSNLLVGRDKVCPVLKLGHHIGLDPSPNSVNPTKNEISFCCMGLSIESPS